MTSYVCELFVNDQLKNIYHLELFTEKSEYTPQHNRQKLMESPIGSMQETIPIMIDEHYAIRYPYGKDAEGIQLFIESGLIFLVVEGKDSDKEITKLIKNIQFY